MQVVALLEQQVGRQVKELLPMQPGDVPETYADIEDLIRDIDFRPADVDRTGHPESRCVVSRLL